MFAALLGVLVAASGAHAKTFVVNPALADGSSSPCSEPCSLRQAIAEANKSPEAENLVEVPPGTYELTQGTVTVDPQLKTTETILGRGSRADEVVIVGNKTSNVMSVGVVGAGAGETVIVQAELTGGTSRTSGGGVRVEPKAKLSLVDASIRANSSLEFGGGVFVGGELDVVDSVIAGNSAARGGGLYGGPITLVNSTIANNTTSGEGGGVYEEAGLKLASATIAGNEAKAGGGLAGGHAVEAFDSLLAQNKPENCAVKIEDAPLGHNLSDDASCRLSSSGDKETGAGLAGLVQEGGLPLLADNGGPTETIALQPPARPSGPATRKSVLPSTSAAKNVRKGCATSAPSSSARNPRAPAEANRRRRARLPVVVAPRRHHRPHRRSRLPSSRAPATWRRCPAGCS